MPIIESVRHINTDLTKGSEKPLYLKEAYDHLKSLTPFTGEWAKAEQEFIKMLIAQDDKNIMTAAKGATLLKQLDGRTKPNVIYAVYNAGKKGCPQCLYKDGKYVESESEEAMQAYIDAMKVLHPEEAKHYVIYSHIYERK